MMVMTKLRGENHGLVSWFNARLAYQHGNASGSAFGVPFGALLYIM